MVVAFIVVAVIDAASIGIVVVVAAVVVTVVVIIVNITEPTRCLFILSGTFYALLHRVSFGRTKYAMLEGEGAGGGGASTKY